MSEIETALLSITGHRLTSLAREQFSHYLELLMEWNRVHRLTGLGSRDDIIRRLFRDSLLFLPLIPDRPLSLLDIGAGSGVPGVPLRIVEPGISLSLIESRRKPVSFLLALKRELGLPDIRVIHGRAETILDQYHDLKGQYDAVVMRAVGLGAPLLKSAMSYLKKGGVLIVSGPPPSECGRHTPPRGLQLKTIEYPELAVSRAFFVAINDS